MELFLTIIVGIVGLGISFLISGCVEKFTSEDAKLEEYLKQFDENDEYFQSIEFEKEYSEVKKNSKCKFKPKFNLAIAIVTIMLLVPLFIFRKDYLTFGINAYLLFLLLIAMFADIKSCIIPDEVNFVGFVTGAVYVFFNLITNFKVGTELLLGGIVGFVIFYLIGMFALLVFKKEGMGGGDIKLMGVIGLFLGFKSIIQVFVLSFFIAAILSVFLIATRIKKKDDYIPFGPFIVIATYITMYITGAFTYNQIYRYFLYK